MTREVPIGYRIKGPDKPPFMPFMPFMPRVPRYLSPTDITPHQRIWSDISDAGGAFLIKNYPAIPARQNMNGPNSGQEDRRRTRQNVEACIEAKYRNCGESGGVPR